MKMTFKEKKEIKNEIGKLINESLELIEKNKLAKDLWELCNSSDNLTIASENYENYYITKEGIKREELVDELLKEKKEFYELFINFVNKYEKK